MAGLTAANAVKVAACIFADGYSLNGKGAAHIAEVAFVLGRSSVLNAHDLASFELPCEPSLSRACILPALVEDVQQYHCSVYDANIVIICLFC